MFEKIEDFIKVLSKFETEIARRAKILLLMNKKIDYDIKLDYISYYDYMHLNRNNVSVYFMEDSFYSPDRHSQDISFKEIDCSNEEFDSYVKHMIILKEQELEDAKRKKEELKKSKTDKKLENKIKQFEKLKLELGR